MRINPFFHRVERSALFTVIGVILLFATSIITILVAPRYVDPTWTSPTSPYQVQMYEIEDPNIYLSSASSNGVDLQYVRHLKQDFSLIAFKESENVRIVAPPELQKYVTKHGDKELKLTSRLLLLREPEGVAADEAGRLRTQLQPEKKPEIQNEKSKGSDKNNDKNKGLKKIDYQFLELYDPHLHEAFVLEFQGGILQNWVDQNFKILDESIKQSYHKNYGVVYSQNPREYRISPVSIDQTKRWNYHPHGQPVKSLEELKSPQLGFHSRQELISDGEHVYAIEGCWYCHTDQTRTLIQDVVLNGSDSFPAPPSSANEYIYQKITFPGTRRIGPDLSRTAVKRPSRDWHKSHFWSPKTASAGSIMPAFRHFFDNDPKSTNTSLMGIPNHQFEAIYQYMMTKGTRITPPTQAWWIGKDAIQTKEIIEGGRQKK